MIPVLTTERLRLRGWTEADFDGFAAFRTDPEASRFVGGAISREDAWRSMASLIGHWVLRGFGFWVVERLEEPGFIGHIGLWRPEGWPENELGWNLLPAFHGQGFASEAARAARTHAYQSLGWPTAISLIDPANTPSQRVAEKLGARPETGTTVRGMPVDIWRHPTPAALAA